MGQYQRPAIRRCDLPIKAAPLPARPDRWLDVITAIEAQPATAVVLALRFGVCLSLMRRQLHWLHQAGIVHVGRWIVIKGQCEPVYAIGAGIDAERPAAAKLPWGYFGQITKRGRVNQARAAA